MKGGDQGISRNIALFMEELRREQEAREKWNAELEKRRNDFRSQVLEYYKFSSRVSVSRMLISQSVLLLAHL